MQHLPAASPVTSQPNCHPPSAVTAFSLGYIHCRQRSTCRSVLHCYLNCVSSPVTSFTQLLHHLKLSTLSIANRAKMSSCPTWSVNTGGQSPCDIAVVVYSSCPNVTTSKPLPITLCDTPELLQIIPSLLPLPIIPSFLLAQMRLYALGESHSCKFGVIFKNENGHYKQFLGKLQLDKCLYVLCHGIAFLSEVSFLNPLAVRFSKLGVAGIHG